MAFLKDKNAKTNPWYFTIEIRENGKRKRIKKRGFKSQKEAKAAYIEFMADRDKGLIQDSKQIYADFLKQYLEHKKTTVKAATLKTYTWLIEQYIIPGLGKYELGKLTPMAIQSFYNTMMERQVIAAENVQKIHTLINDSLKRAERWELVNKNVAQLVDRPRAVKPEIQVWDKEQSVVFLKVAREQRLFIAFLLALTTGMRQSEILGLRWKDVDLVGQLLYVTQSLSHDGKTLSADLKTKNASRKIVIPPEVAAELKKHKARQNHEALAAGPLYKNNDLVVCTSTGTPMIPRNLMRTYYSLLDKCDVPRIRFHELRHTHATLLLKENINPKIVAERLGHADVRITLDTYSHLLPDMQRDAVSQFGKMFFDSPAPLDSKKVAEK